VLGAAEDTVHDVDDLHAGQQAAAVPEGDAAEADIGVALIVAVHGEAGNIHPRGAVNEQHRIVVGGGGEVFRERHRRLDDSHVHASPDDHQVIGGDVHLFSIGASQDRDRGTDHSVDTVLDAPEGVVAIDVAGAVGRVVGVHCRLIDEVIVHEHVGGRFAVVQCRRALPANFRVVVAAAVHPAAAGTVLPGAEPVGHPVDVVLVGDLVQAGESERGVGRCLPVLVIGIDAVAVVNTTVGVLAIQQDGDQPRDLGGVYPRSVEGVDEAGDAEVVPPEVPVRVGGIVSLVVDDIEQAGIVVERVLPEDLGHVDGVLGVVGRVAGIAVIEHDRNHRPDTDVPGDDAVGIVLGHATHVANEDGQGIGAVVGGDLGVIPGLGGVHVGGAENTRQIVVFHQEWQVGTRIDVGIG